MADFVAVIRRAVDGLTDNTPEMRVRVYDKARGAVVRQLENMNPRPPEAMFKRQLDKLDDAIRQVEEEHSAALPAEEPAEEATSVASPEPFAAAPEPEPAGRGAVDEPVQAEPVRHEAPGEPVAYHAEPADEQPRHEDAIRQQPADERPAYESTAYRQTATHPDPIYRAEPVYHPEPEYREVPAAVVHAEPARVEEPVVRHAEPHVVRQEVTQPAAAIHQPAERQDDPLLSHFVEQREPAIRHAANRVMEEPSFGVESEIPGSQPHAQPTMREHYAEPRQAAPAQAWGVDIDREPEAARAEPDFAPVGEPPAQMPRAVLTETDVASGFNAFIKDEFSTPAVKPPPVRKEPENDFSWDAPFDDLPDLPKPVAFDQALHARQEELARAPEPVAQQPRADRRDARAELEDLIGYRPVDDNARSEANDGLPPEVARGMSKLEGKSFKVGRKAKQKFNPLPIAFGIGAALIVAGGAFAAYTYRDDVSSLVASVMPSESAPEESETRDVAADATSETKSVAVDTENAPAADQTAAKPADGEQPTEVASLDPNIGPSKFTQRLLADGTEAETDAAKIPVDTSLTEGKTIAGQTVAAETEVASSNPATATVATTANAEGLTAAQKMILYEERLGDTPLAVQGKVTWRLKPDTTSANGKEQSMVEATVEVPERKLKAVVSFKRNNDASLPASHIVEVVFDLPEDFAEGNVENVQRIAFKQTEQDRGNGLIAVPAKITDDFHMIALNDDAEARKVNTELMKTRSWIDIPVVYRNNRRGLLTFEKGSTGTEAFDKALAEWAALGPTANN